MKANELRIGNYVNPFKDQAHKVVGIVGELIGLEFDFNMVIQDNIKNVKPIPLTEEWLLKFGFKQWKDCKRWSNKTVLIYTNRTSLFYYGKVRNRICIEYVHQLQNLYFALTGEELKIKEDE